MTTPTDLRWAPDGLVPVIVQDGADGRVLMLAYTNAEALALTLASGEVHFWSRSRRSLWRKGETSGNVLVLHNLALDCDGDALLASVEPGGPTCHRGTRSCFDGGEVAGSPASAPGAWSPASSPLVSPETPSLAPAAASAPSAAASAPSAEAETPEGFGWLETLWSTIAARAASRPEGSYTARLLAEGVDGPARKVAEEATEVLMAAKDDAVAEHSGAPREALRDALAGEVADLVYHALVLLAERGLPPAAVIASLKQRHAG
jgi:phosphoribosyl-ATP pyrophosphohydrolase/phosphoribosyl-AMP cyclohydrolase